MREHRLKAPTTRLESLFAAALREGVFSGATLLVAGSREVFFQKTWGTACLGGPPVTEETRFDLASLTKPLVTAALCMVGVSAGTLALDDPLSRFFPASLLPRDKREITLCHLLNHCSGLPAYEPFYRELIAHPLVRRRDLLLARLIDTPLLSPPGKTCLYSDLGFLLLGFLLEDVEGRSLDCLARVKLFAPLDIDTFQFNPLQVGTTPSDGPNFAAPALSPIPYAATEQCPWRSRLLLGEVHDENAYCLGGVAGHAGLFGTARGVHLLLASLWDTFRSADTVAAPWSSDVVRTFWEKPGMDPCSTWALGFDTPSQGQSSAGKYFSPRSIGHLGFTGTSFWLDLDQDVLVVLLTNRVHPSRLNEKLKTFRPLLHNTVMESLDVHTRH